MKKIQLTLFESTLLIECPASPYYQIVKAKLPTRRAVSIEEFEGKVEPQND